VRQPATVGSQGRLITAAPPLEEKSGRQPAPREMATDEECHREIVNRQLDERRRPKDLMIDPDIGKTGPQLGERRFPPRV